MKKYILTFLGFTISACAQSADFEGKIAAIWSASSEKYGCAQFDKLVETGIVAGKNVGKIVEHVVKQSEDASLAFELVYNKRNLFFSWSVHEQNKVYLATARIKLDDAMRAVSFTSNLKVSNVDNSGDLKKIIIEELR